MLKVFRYYCHEVNRYSQSGASQEDIELKTQEAVSSPPAPRRRPPLAHAALSARRALPLA